MIIKSNFSIARFLLFLFLSSSWYPPLHSRLLRKVQRSSHKNTGLRLLMGSKQRLRDSEGRLLRTSCGPFQGSGSLNGEAAFSQPLPLPDQIRKMTEETPKKALCVCVLTTLVLSDSMRPHGLQPSRLLCPWDSPGKNTGVGCHSLRQGIFPTQGSNPGLLHCRQTLYHLSYQGSPDRH